MKKNANANHFSHANPAISRYTRFSIWWLKNFEEITHFWTGFSWVWAATILLSAIVGYMPFIKAVLVLFITGAVIQTGMLLCIRSISAHLKSLKEGPEKEHAHMLMIQIIKRRL